MHQRTIAILVVKEMQIKAQCDAITNPPVGLKLSG
jgi:hypothetical protein